MATPRPFRTWHFQLAMFTWIGWHYRDVHWTSSIDETRFDWQFGSACKSYQSAIGTDQQSFPPCHQSLEGELHSMECFPFLCARTCHHAHHGELIDFMGPSACACAFLYAHILASHSKWALAILAAWAYLRHENEHYPSGQLSDGLSESITSTWTCNGQLAAFSMDSPTRWPCSNALMITVCQLSDQPQCCSILKQ